MLLVRTRKDPLVEVHRQAISLIEFGISNLEDDGYLHATRPLEGLFAWSVGVKSVHISVLLGYLY